MSSNQFFTQVNNALIDGNVMISALSGADVNALLFAGALAKNSIITLASAVNYSLTSADFVQAAAGVQLVNSSAIAAGTSLLVGADAASVAAQYINLFQLSSGSGGKVLLRFQIDQKVQGAAALALANSSGTSTNVVIQLAGASSASTQQLFGSGAAAGLQNCVEVWATNVTSGSQAVVFNVV